MGYSTSSDMCPNFLQIDCEELIELDDNSIGIKILGWICVDSAESCGEEGELYGVFLQKDSKEVFIVHSDDNSNIVGLFSPDLDSVLEIQKDFNLPGIIKKQKAFSQTI